MPELPEVETVRRGLVPLVSDRVVRSLSIRSPRPLRRQQEGAQAFTAWVTGSRITGVQRRGKYLWLPLSGAGGHVIVAHLGMSGQFRTIQADAEPGPHERVRFELDDGCVLAFVDQRTFGWLLADTAQDGVPSTVAHIGLDPFDERFDLPGTGARLREKRTSVKRALLDQTLMSGVGNIYADETLWRAQMHPSLRADSLTQAAAQYVLGTAREVMSEALAAGGTSFDPLYVDVNGESGWFARDLAAYGREGLPCLRCGHPIVREAFTNRSSYRCPECQQLPRQGR